MPELLCQRPYEPEWPEHFQVLFVVLASRADTWLAAGGNGAMEPGAPPCAQRQVVSQTGVGFLSGHDHLVHGATVRRATTDHALDAVLGQPPR